MKSADIQKIILDVLSDDKEHTVQEIKTVLNNTQEEYSEGQFSGSINTLVRNGAIQKNSRGVYSKNNRSSYDRMCFVVSVIGDENSEERKASDQVFNYIIKPVCEDAGLNPIRVDQLNQADTINQTIIDYLNNSDLVIADITGHNPNVFYEIGYRAAINKPMIYMRSSGESIPFDIAGVRLFEYNRNDLDSVNEVKSRLVKTIETISFSDRNGVDTGMLGYEMIGETSFLPLLYEIKDGLSDLKKTLQEKEDHTLQTIIKSMAPTVPIEDPQTTIMKAILPDLIRNPDSLRQLMDISTEMKKKST